jgi:hypothetical protein
MTKTTKKPNKLSKTGKKAGIQLTEAQLDQASGGLTFLKAPLKTPG